ncbi:hypothetical protein BDD12DRAFT_831187, partial [Trichophaea hybrida]
MCSRRTRLWLIVELCSVKFHLCRLSSVSPRLNHLYLTDPANLLPLLGFTSINISVGLPYSYRFPVSLTSGQTNQPTNSFSMLYT